MKNSYSEKTLTKNSFLRVFKKFILRIILYLNQKKLVQDIFKSELNIKDVIIKESSKPIIDILYVPSQYVKLTVLQFVKRVFNSTYSPFTMP